MVHNSIWFCQEVRFTFLRKMIINAISGPRNISTALMYSFAQHSQIKVVDEPFYAYYLLETGLDHPGREEIIADMEADPEKIIAQIQELNNQYEVVFLKNMAHHHLGLDWNYLNEMKNLFLIRDPKHIITSYIKVIGAPSLKDIGLKEEFELLEHVVKCGAHPPVVIDSNQTLGDPEGQIRQLCSKLEIDFEPAMLKWEPHQLEEDGIWAKYWYKNVHESTEFAKQQIKERTLPEQFQRLYQEALPYYEQLLAYV